MNLNLFVSLFDTIYIKQGNEKYIYSSSILGSPSSSSISNCLLMKGLQQMSPLSHLQYFVHERPALLQLQRVPLHALHSAVQLQLTTSTSAWGATGAVQTAGVMAEPSMFQPKLAMFRLSSGGSRWSAAFHSSI